MAKQSKKIKKTYTLEPETVAIIERMAKDEKRNENSVVDRAVQLMAKAS